MLTTDALLDPTQPPAQRESTAHLLATELEWRDSLLALLYATQQRGAVGPWVWWGRDILVMN